MEASKSEASCWALADALESLASLWRGLGKPCSSNDGHQSGCRRVRDFVASEEKPGRSLEEEVHHQPQPAYGSGAIFRLPASVRSPCSMPPRAHSV